MITEMRRRTGAEIRVYSKADKPKYLSFDDELVQVTIFDNSYISIFLYVFIIWTFYLLTSIVPVHLFQAFRLLGLQLLQEEPSQRLLRGLELGL